MKLIAPTIDMPTDDPVTQMKYAKALQHRAKPPYWYEDMPPEGIPFFVENNGNVSNSTSSSKQPSPAFGAANQIVVATYQCPLNFVAVLRGILATFEGSGFVPGSGNIIWTLDVDVPLPSVTASAGYAFDGYANMITPKGSYANGLWKLYPGLRFADGETIRLKVQTVAVVGTGAPNFMNGELAGYIVPMHLAFL